MKINCENQERYFVGVGYEGRKIAWVSWKVICKPKKVGDLGIKDMRCFNRALLGQWV